MPKVRLQGEEIRPIAPWNKWGSGVGFLTHAHILGHTFLDGKGFTSPVMSLGVMIIRMA